MDIKESRFLYFTQTSKMMSPEDCDELCICNIIFRVTTK